MSKLPYWSALSEREKRAVADAAVLRKYQSGSILQTACDGGTDGVGMICIVSGEVRAYTVSDQGREITLFRIDAGECCVLASCLAVQSRLETQLAVTTDADILVIPTGVFDKLAKENVHVRCFLYQLAADQLSTVVWVMQQILFARFDQRLAVFFLNEYRKTGSARICMTQEQIAQNVNSAREVVARMLRRFAAEGLIESRRGLIVLKDIPGLERLK